MTVAEMEDRMTNREFIHWSMFYALRQQEAELAEKMSKARGGRR
jgi:hypothetical protein